MHNVLQVRKFAPSSALSSNPANIPLPPDFWETSIAWMTIAEEMIDSLPDVWDSRFQAHAVGALGEVVHAIDKAVESLDSSDPLLLPLCHLLYLQSFVIKQRFIISRDFNDLHRGLRILEMIPQLCDPADTPFIRQLSAIGSFPGFSRAAAALKLPGFLRHPDPFQPIIGLRAKP